MLDTYRTWYLLCSATILAAIPMVMPVPIAQATPKVTTCGAEISSMVTTETDLGTTSSLVFVDVPGAVQNFTVPTGSTSCVKVVFTGEAACQGSGVCLIQALIDGVQMRPQGGTRQAFVSSDTFAGAHAYEWVRTVAAGSHVARIQQKVSNANTFFELDDWTFDLQIYE